MNVIVEPTQYNPADINVGIVHIGLGAFVRAHIAVYIEKLLHRSPGPWGICAANIRSNKNIVNTLRDQKGQYTVAEYLSEEELTLRQISCLREVLYAGQGNTETLLARLARPETKIVTLTITEKGYFYDAANDTLKIDAPEIQHDLGRPQQPQTAIGILVAALHGRWQNNQPPFTVMSCDNMAHNGAATRGAVVALARQSYPQLAEWIIAEVPFPSTMVDRIVPAVTEDTLKKITQQLADNTHWKDKAPVACESFSQWVIEDKFSDGRPALEQVGAVLVDDVAPWEAMKLRMLNGSHSLLAYLGYLSGFQYVSDCVEEPSFCALLRHYMLEEAAPTLNMPEGTNLEQYADALLQRFSNTSLHHQTFQIAMDGSQKIPQRWLDGARAQLDAGGMPYVTALGFAGWIRFLQGADEQHQKFEVNDPMAAELQALARQQSSPRDKTIAFLELPIFAHYTLATHSRFVDAIADALITIESEGVLAAMHSTPVHIPPRRRL